jgi:hypothetical protein
LIAPSLALLTQNAHAIASNHVNGVPDGIATRERFGNPTSGREDIVLGAPIY